MATMNPATWPTPLKIGLAAAGVGGAVYFATRGGTKETTEEGDSTGDGDTVLPLITPVGGPTFPAGAQVSGNDYAPPSGAGSGSSGAGADPTLAADPNLTADGTGGSDPHDQDRIEELQERLRRRQGKIERVQTAERAKRVALKTRLKAKIDELRAQLDRQKAIARQRAKTGRTIRGLGENRRP